MNLEHYRQLLQAKEKELMDAIATNRKEAGNTIDPEVQDEMDMVTRSEAKEELLNENTREFELLVQVRDALHRLEDGSYGKCLVCGKDIPEKRLEAVPWAAYDVEHQAEQENTRSSGENQLLL